MSVNTKHKDSVFSFLFSNPDDLRALYCAIEGVTLPPDTPIDINTLTDILYMDQINDVSFTIDNRLVVLIEHQATINRNMPIRLLMYIARVYEKIIDRRKLYQKNLEKIPTPEFIVLYNGKAPQGDYEVLKLSEAFKNTGGIKGADAFGTALELVVQVYNINKGHNTALIKKCETLEGYSVFVDKFREYEQSLAKEEAMKSAIKYCMDNNILRPFFEKNATEVFNMLLTEWDTEEAKQVWYEEGLEDGLERGLEKGLQEGLEEGLEKGLQEGLEKGLQEGLERGLERGLQEGLEEGLDKVARNALAQGASLDFIQKITGLDIQTIARLQK